MSDMAIPAGPVTVTERIRRIFNFGGTQLADPDPTMSPDAVRKMYASSGYPILTNASVTGPETANGKATYTFKAAVGTKG